MRRTAHHPIRNQSFCLTLSPQHVVCLNDESNGSASTMEQSNASNTLALRRSYRRHPRALRFPRPVKKGQVAWMRPRNTWRAELSRARGTLDAPSWLSSISSRFSKPWLLGVASCRGLRYQVGDRNFHLHYQSPRMPLALEFSFKVIHNNLAS
jgi:hypothetical protein